VSGSDFLRSDATSHVIGLFPELRRVGGLAEPQPDDDDAAKTTA